LSRGRGFTIIAAAYIALHFGSGFSCCYFGSWLYLSYEFRRLSYGWGWWRWWHLGLALCLVYAFAGFTIWHGLIVTQKLLDIP